MGKSFVGFGCGPIQTGLMLLEAQNSGNFDRYTVAEIDQHLVDAIRRNKNGLTVNIAHTEGIEQKRLAGIEILNPQDAADRKTLVAAIAQADEMATAIPSVKFYATGGEASIVSLLAAAINTAKPRLLYASENNNYAAEILREALEKETAHSRLSRFQICNTVIGKMSGVIADSGVIERLDLAPMTENGKKAVLVEEFNRILISKIALADFKRGIEVFEEKEDLIAFEEAKLFGHNAIHAMLGYLAYEKGYAVMSEIGGDAALMDIGRDTFYNESGAALIRKYGGIGEALFTEEGYRAYADDLLARIINPYLNDEVARVCRDPRRKLSYGDRIFGTMREALAQGVAPKAMARGALAGLRYIIDEKADIGAPIPESRESLNAQAAAAMLDALWKDDARDDYCGDIISMVCSHL